MPSSKILPTFELYAEQLHPLQLGYALYEPNPDLGEDEVRVGDIGYIFHGRFVRIASVFESGHGISAVDEAFHRISSFADLDSGVLSSESVRSERFELEASASEPMSGVSMGVCVKMSCHSDCGASLITRFRATVEKSAFPNVLKAQFTKDVQSIFDSAQTAQFPIENLHDIILVTGRVMTGDWATIAFHSRSQESSASFDIKAATVNASGTVWGKWSEHVNFPKRHGPTRTRAIRDGEEPALNQCIFIETHRIYERPWYEKLKPAFWIKQKKGPPADIGGIKRRLGKISRGLRSSQTAGLRQVGESAKDNDSQEATLTAYDVLAFRAFHMSDASFNFICIDEEDVKRLLPTSSTTSSVLEDLENSAELAAANFEVAKLDSDARPKTGTLRHSARFRDDESINSFFDDEDRQSISERLVILSSQPSTSESHIATAISRTDKKWIRSTFKERSGGVKLRTTIKVIVLGQSESGKSTLVKQLHRYLSPASFHRERMKWRAVIYLNIIHSVRCILETIHPHSSSSTSSPDSAMSLSSSTRVKTVAPYLASLPRPSSLFGDGGYNEETDELRIGNLDPSAHRLEARESSPLRPSNEDLNGDGSSLQAKFKRYSEDLAPLVDLEGRLMHQLALTAKNGEVLSLIYSDRIRTPGPPPTTLSRPQTKSVSKVWPWKSMSKVSVSSSSSGSVSSLFSNTYTHSSASSLSFISSSSISSRPSQNMSAGNPWRKFPALEASNSSIPTPAFRSNPLATISSGEPTPLVNEDQNNNLSLPIIVNRHDAALDDLNIDVAGESEDLEDIMHLLHTCAYAEHGILALWKDQDVRGVLKEKGMQMEEISEFFLSELERVVGKAYVPTDDDILKARLDTPGILEHAFVSEVEHEANEEIIEWKFFDVGGARTQRLAWAPYFEDVNTIIFLAPLSEFNQVSAESGNRLEDSVNLWRSVVMNKHLSNISLILLLNKCDLLRAKLDAGVQVKDYVPSYGSQSNDFATVTNYFKAKFSELHKSQRCNHSRDLWIHITNTVTEAQSFITKSVREIVLRKNMENADLI